MNEHDPHLIATGHNHSIISTRHKHYPYVRRVFVTTLKHHFQDYTALIGTTVVNAIAQQVLDVVNESCHVRERLTASILGNAKFLSDL